MPSFRILPAFAVRVLRALAWLAALAAWPALAHQGVTHATAAVEALASVEMTGRVDAIAVRDRATGATQRFPVLALPDGRRVRLDNAGTVAPGTLLTVTGILTRQTLTAQSLRSPAPGATGAIAPKSAGRGEATGTLRMFHVDYPDGHSDYGFALVPDHGRTNIVDLGTSLPIANGARATISGPVNADGYIEVDTIEVEAATAGPTPSTLALATPAAVTTGYTVVPLQFPSNATAPFIYGTPPITIATIQGNVFGAAPAKSVAEYYKEVSYGNQLLSGTVAATAGSTWFQATVARPTACSTSAQLDAVLNTIETQSTALVGASVLNSRPGILYISDSLPCGWSGLGYIDWARAYTNGSAALLVVGHELGHNFGLYHAGSVNCGSAVLAPSGCSVAEYGDSWDIMGNKRAMHFNVHQKDALAYVPPSGVAEHGGGSATYVLGPLESPGQPLYGIRIATSNPKRTYWVEFRQPIGFDSALSGATGAQVRVASPFENICSGCADDTQLLDMTPGDGTFDNGTLAVGNTYTDATYGISIQVVSGTATALTVKVSTGGTTSSVTTLASSVNPSAPGQQITFTATVTGSAPTGNVSFNADGAGIAGCTAVALAGAGNARTASCTTASLAAGTHAITAMYAGNAQNTASTSATLTQTVNGGATIVPTATSVVTSSNPSPQGAVVTLTATVTSSPAVAGGTVAFTASGTPIAGCGATPIVAAGALRTATCTTSTLATGAYGIVASYGGNGTSLASASPPILQVIPNPAIGNSVQFASAAYAVNEGGGSVTLVVTRIGDDATPASVNYATAGGTASADVDFTSRSGTLSWAAHDASSRLVTVPIANDAQGEANETFAVTLTNPAGAALGANATATVTIYDGSNTPLAMPGTATVVRHPYGTLSVSGATLSGNVISGFTRTSTIRLGATPGGAGSFAKIDFQGFDIGPGNSLVIQSGAAGQTVYLANVGASLATITGALVIEGANGAPPPAIVIESEMGLTVDPAGSIAAPGGLVVDALGTTATTGGNVLNQGAIDGGPSLRIDAAKVNGGGRFVGNAVAFATFGNLNNPATGLHFLANGLQLYPATGNTVALSAAGYGLAPQFMNLTVNGNATFSMPSVWPNGSTLPATNRPVLAGQSRAAGTPDPAFGGGSIIVQATGNLTLDGGASADFVFPGGIALRTSGTLDTHGTTIDNAWTTSGQSFQGVFMEAAQIVDTTIGGALAIRTNDRNWANFSARPAMPVSTWTLQMQPDGTQAFVAADAAVPHLNLYSIETEANAAGQCWVCLVYTQPVSLSAP